MSHAHPSPEEIATPWAPQPIVWRPEDDYSARHASDLQNEAQAGRPYLVREVNVQGFEPDHGPYGRYYTPTTVDETWNVIKRAEEEFDILRTCGVHIPDLAWHVEPYKDKVLTLARVAVIDGWDLELHSRSWTQDLYGKDTSQIRNNMRNAVIARQSKSTYKYYSSGAPGRRLQDVNNAIQHRYGVPRNRSLSQKAAIYLLDIEPIF